MHCITRVIKCDCVKLLRMHRVKWKLISQPMCSSFNSVQLLSHVRTFATPWTAAHEASLSITNSQSLLKLMSIELVIPQDYWDFTSFSINVLFTFLFLIQDTMLHLVVISSQYSLDCDKFLYLSLFSWPWQFWRIFISPASLIFFSWSEPPWCSDFCDEPQMWCVLLITSGDLWYQCDDLITGETDFDHLVKVGCLRFPYCNITVLPLSPLYSL